MASISTDRWRDLWEPMTETSHVKGQFTSRSMGVPTKALVTTALKEELIIGWPDLIKLGVIGDSFPHPIRAIHLQENNIELVEKLRNEFPEAFLRHATRESPKGA